MGSVPVPRNEPDATASGLVAFHRLPQGGFCRAWLLAVVLALAVLTVLEGVWRTLGVEGSVRDDFNLWCVQRDRASAAAERGVVLLGASRMQAGVVPGLFEERCPGAVVAQLAIDGRQPMATLHDVALDNRVRGTVLCSFTPQAVLPESWAQQAGHVAYYRRHWTAYRRYMRGVHTILQENLRILLPEFQLQRVFWRVVRGQVPKQVILTRVSRQREMHYDRLFDLGAYAQARLERTRRYYDGLAYDAGPAVWRGYLARVQEDVEAIQARGGRVVFLRLPTSGGIRALDEQHFPRAEYWDVFARTIGAPAIHFEDVPALAGFTCPEGSHLRYADAREFTRALVDELNRRGLLPMCGAA